MMARQKPCPAFPVAPQDGPTADHFKPADFIECKGSMVAAAT